MHWSRELLALTAGVRWRIAGLVAIGLLIVAASLASLVCAGRAIAAVFAGQSSIDFWFLIAGAAAAAVVRGVLLYLRETAGERTAAAVKQALRTRLYRQLLVLGPGYLERRRTGEWWPAPSTGWNSWKRTMASTCRNSWSQCWRPLASSFTCGHWIRR